MFCNYFRIKFCQSRQYKFSRQQRVIDIYSLKILGEYYESTTSGTTKSGSDFKQS
jgi:hypothetical protein